ncbi:MAG: RIP metalloprotease RseP [Methylocella sp.]
MTFFAYLWAAAADILPFIFVLSLVVFFHEMGHFLVGRFCGVKVDAFSLGFGPELFAFVDRFGTRWRVGALPLGGYVKFHGDANGASMTDTAAAAMMSREDRAVSFFAQNVWKRAAIVVAGPIANFILAIAIFTGIYCVNGIPIQQPLVDKVIAGSAAEAGGFQPGDLIVSINGDPIDSWEAMTRVVQRSSDTALTFDVDRQGKRIILVATPRRRDISTPFGATRAGVLGVETLGRPGTWRVQHDGITRSFARAASDTWYVVARTGSYVGGLVMGREGADRLSGPIRIAEVSGDMAKIGIAALLNLAALLSISVGLLNLMPVPLLDGGHLFYYAVEVVRGRALDERTQALGFKVGLTLVAGLMVFSTYNDILRLARQMMLRG